MGMESCPKRDCEPTCINCGGPHRASNYNCPEYILQRKAREISAHENVPLSEATSRIRGRPMTSQEHFSSHYNSKFPKLPSSSSVFRERSVPPPPSQLFSRVLSSSPLERDNSLARDIASPPQPLYSSNLLISLSGALSNFKHKSSFHNLNHMTIIIIGLPTRVLAREQWAPDREPTLILSLLLHSCIRTVGLLRLLLATAWPSKRDSIPLRFFR